MPKRDPRVNFTREPTWTTKPGGGYVVTDEFRRILAQPGFLNDSNGAQRALTLYPDGSMGFRLEDFSMFGQACFCGNVPYVEGALRTGQAPPLSTKESAYEQGYASLVILGSQRLGAMDAPGAPKTEHLAVLELLITRGLPLDLPDIAGYTALQHAVMENSIQDHEKLVRKLLTSGADVNYQNKWGSTPLHGAVMRANILGIDLLMEHGASIDIADGNGYTVRGFYNKAGPAVNAAIEKWLTRRSGKEEAPMTGKRCERCAAWSTHKKACKTFDNSTSVTLIAHYRDSRFAQTLPLATLQRGIAAGLPTESIPIGQMRGNQAPTNLPASGKQAVVKIQIPPVLKNPDGSYNDMMVYTQKRDFACMVRRRDCPKEFDRVYDVIKTQTISQLKGYFSAEIKSRDEFAVKVSEVLASQPW